MPRPSLFDAVINVTNTTSAVTNIALSFTNGISTRVAAIFAVSGAAVGAVPPVFGYAPTPTPGQPFATNATVVGGATARAVVNGVAMLKAWEGTNKIVINVTNIAGSGPIVVAGYYPPSGYVTQLVDCSSVLSTSAQLVGIWATCCTAATTTTTTVP